MQEKVLGERMVAAEIADLSEFSGVLVAVVVDPAMLVVTLTRLVRLQSLALAPSKVPMIISVSENHCSEETMGLEFATPPTHNKYKHT